MKTINETAAKTLHRLLYRALVEMRAQGHETKNKLVFHLADLFHNVVLEMGNAAEARTTYDEVLTILQKQADEKGLTRWLEGALGDIVGNELAAKEDNSDG